MITAGVDPDTHHPSVVILNGNLVIFAAAGEVPREVTGDRAALAAIRWFKSLGGLAFCGIDRAVVEGQEVYPDTPLGKSGIDGLLRLALVSGGIAGTIMAWEPRAEVLVPTPTEWKRQQPKLDFLSRVLDPNGFLERVPRIARPHLSDAIGLALWGQGRQFALASSHRDLMERARTESRKISTARRRGR